MTRGGRAAAASLPGDETRRGLGTAIARVTAIDERLIGLLQAIEKAADERFAAWAGDVRIPDAVTASAELIRSASEGLLYVAKLDDGGEPVGWASGSLLAVAEARWLHLDQVSVLPEAGGRGIGGALVQALVHEAGRRACSAVSLVTFRDVPWNGPWYRRLGFEPLSPDRYPAAIVHLVEAEQAAGMVKAEREVLWKALPTPAEQL